MRGPTRGSEDDGGASEFMSHDVIAAVIAAAYFGTVAVMAVIGFRRPRYSPGRKEVER